MAHGWDSYFHNLPPVSSDPSTLIKASESEENLSQHIENFIGHHDFSSTEASHEVPATNSNFNTNYYSNPSIGNSTSDCVYQKYCRETSWEADGEQMEKDYLSGCGITDLSNLATDGLSTSFPSSFATDLQGLKQDCGIIGASFLENYSDVSSCSDTEDGEPRPSCKFMASNPASETNADVATKHSSSEWLFTQTENMPFPTENVCSNMSETDVPIPSNVKAEEVECSQDKMESQEKNVKSYKGNDQSSTTCKLMTTTGSKTVEDGDKYDVCQDQAQKEDMERDLTQEKYSDILMSGNEHVAGDGGVGNEEKLITTTVLNVKSTCDNEQEPSVEKVLREEMRESLDKENNGCDKPNSTECQDRNMRDDEQDKCEGERKKCGSLENDIFDELKSSNPETTEDQIENIETDCQEKDIQSNTPRMSEPQGINVSDYKDAANEQTHCSSTVKSNNNAVESSSQLSDYQSHESVPQYSICGSPAVMNISNISNTCDNIEQNVASHSGPIDSSTGLNPAKKKITTSPSDPDSSDPVVTGNKELSVFNSLESCLQSNTSSTDGNPCPDKEQRSPKESTNTSCCLIPEGLNGDVAEIARESFDELNTPAEELSVVGMLYGEPLSREDSSCDTDETQFDTSQDNDTSVHRSDSKHTNHSEEQPAQLKSSAQMRKRMQPVVILRNLEPVNGISNSYHCADCQHATHSVDHLIEHHHCCHSVHSFQFCKTCDSYLIRNELAETHMCGVTKESSELPSVSSLQKKKKRCGRHKCITCGLIFSKLYQYIRHMRSHTGKTPYKCNGCGLYFAQASTLQRHKNVPGRCKMTTFPVKDPDAVVRKAKAPPQKDLVQNKPYANLPECCVKLVDISKTNLYRLCSKSFSPAEKAKKHLHNINKGKNLAFFSSQCTTTVGGEESQKVNDETKGKYKCPLCPRLFKYSYNRARHLRDCVSVATNGGKGKLAGKYLCPLCHTTFTLSSNRYRHIKTFCLRDCLNRLAKERAKSMQKFQQTTQSKENEHNKRPKENEQKKQSKDDEQKKQPTLVSRAPKPVPRYKCNLCPALFCHASGKYRHMKKHELFKLTGKMFKYRNSAFSTVSKPATSSSPETEESKDDLKSTEAKSTLALSCHFCGKCFGTSQSLKKHERNHRGERPYRCLECGKGFKKRAYLIGHKNVHQRRIQCTVCRKILPTIGELIQHRSSHLKRGMLQCPDCQQQFQYPAHLLRHLRSHKRKENKSPQPEEGPPLKPQQSWETIKKQSGPKQLQCSLCKEMFDDAQVLRKHCLTHISRSSTTKCPFCGDNFTNRRYLVRHMVKHTGDKPFSCLNCGKQFYRDLYLKLHSAKCLPTQTRPLATMESDAKGSHPCSYCPRMFYKKNRLKNHHRGHKTNTLLLCSRCGQYFGFRKLNQHQMKCSGTSELNTTLSLNEDVLESMSHAWQNVPKKPLQSSDAKNMFPFKCPHCTRRFRFRSLFFRHLVSHTGLQPYACRRCGSRYRSQTLCLQHESFCDGVFTEGQSKVKRYAATHASDMNILKEAAQKSQAEGAAEYKCKFCTKTFMKSRNLRRHILTHNEVKPYRCKACDSCFSRYDHLKVHQTRCKGKRARLEVCIPKISLDDVGKGWQNKFAIEAAEKQESFDCEICSRSFATQAKLARHNTLFHVTKQFKCTRCGSSFTHEKSLKSHRKMKRCRKVTQETNVSAENETASFIGVRNHVFQRIQPYFNKKGRFVCSYCPRTFRNGWQLNVHTRLHTGERPYPCDYCGQRFIRKDYLQRHFLKCSKKARLESHKKSYTSTHNSSKSTVCQSQQTQSSQSALRGFSCAYCSSRFLIFSQLQEHFLNAHKMETMVPPVSTAPLQHHLSNIPNIKEEPVDKSCSEEINDGANLICQLDTALDAEFPKPFTCSECNMSFSNKAGLAGHARIHAVENPFTCKTCNKGFWNKSLLRNHYRKCRFGCISERNATQELEVPLKAEIDFALSDSVLVFKEGSKTTGTGVLRTNFSCKEDQVDESSQNSGDQVQGSSSQEKKAVQFQCSECDKSYTDGLMLISHLEEHGRQEQAKKHNTCTKCGRVCASQGNLEKHMKLHEIEKEYPCPDCSKMVYTSDLENHRTCHDPNRPYACKLCHQRFWTRLSLCSHYSEDHPDDVFTCRFCSKTYSVKKSLARHYRKWHQKEQRDLGNTVQGKSSTEQQSSSQVSATGESDEDENNFTEDSDSDSAPYFPCHVCGKTFPTSESLEDHQRCHLGEKPHECAECGRCFFQASQLQQHQRMHKSEFQCQACGRGFVSLFALRKHKHTHGKSRPYRCSKCHLSFTGPTQLAEHMSTHQEENFPCDICNRVFLSKSSRAEHRKYHSKSGESHPPSVSRKVCEKLVSLSESSVVFTKELKYRCGVCSERFRDPEELSEHGCMEAKERPYSCLDCDKHFLHASHLKKHRSTHQLSFSTGEYSCNKCNNSFSSSQHFLSHLKSHDDGATAEMKLNMAEKYGGSSRGFICPVCRQCFAASVQLIHHFPSHMDGAFQCKTCQMTFTSGTKLEEHERYHLASSTEHECTMCGQSFLGREAFCQHHCSRQQHTERKTEYSNPTAKTSPPTYQAEGDEEEVDVTGEDFFNCPVCSMLFSSKSGLLEHQNKQHPNEKPFKCELCGKTFAMKRYLKEHERRHRQKLAAQTTTRSEQNVQKCTQCRAEFSSAQDLAVHKRLHAENIEYRCDMCYKSFSQWSLLRQHQESHVGQVVYECTECDKAFAFPHLLEEHQQTHAGSSR